MQLGPQRQRWQTVCVRWCSLLSKNEEKQTVSGKNPEAAGIWNRKRSRYVGLRGRNWIWRSTFYDAHNQVYGSAHRGTAHRFCAELCDKIIEITKWSNRVQPPLQYIQNQEFHSLNDIAAKSVILSLEFRQWRDPAFFHFGSQWQTSNRQQLHCPAMGLLQPQHQRDISRTKPKRTSRKP